MSSEETMNEDLNGLVVDGRWSGQHGIGRFSQAVLEALNPAGVTWLHGHHPPSPRGLLEAESAGIRESRSRPRVFFTPGFTAPLTWPGPVILTVHDLFHIDVPEESSPARRLYYDKVLRRACRRAHSILTVSEYSRQRILEWSGVRPDQVVVVGNGRSRAFSPHGVADQPGHPYLLHVGNRRPHKNLPNVLRALAAAADDRLHLHLTGEALDGSLRDLATSLGIQHRIMTMGSKNDHELASAYRGALAVIVASTHEGFGLPALEAMACGAPVIASDTTAIPEVVGDSAVFVQPKDPASITRAIDRIQGSPQLVDRLAQSGPRQAARFEWENVAAKVETHLREVRLS